MVNKVHSIGVIGHRYLGGSDAYDYAHLTIFRVLGEFKREYNELIAISAVSEGADTLFAKSAIALNIKLESVIPYDNFSSDFSLEESLERYVSIRKASNKESLLRFQQRSNQAYKKSMEWIVFKSSTVIAIWDGKEIGTVGGTWEAISLCKKMRKKIIHIDTVKKVINVHTYSNNRYVVIRDISHNEILRYI